MLNLWISKKINQCKELVQYSWRVYVIICLHKIIAFEIPMHRIILYNYTINYITNIFQIQFCNSYQTSSRRNSQQISGSLTQELQDLSATWTHTICQFQSAKICHWHSPPPIQKTQKGRRKQALRIFTKEISKNKEDKCCKSQKKMREKQ